MGDSLEALDEVRAAPTSKPPRPTDLLFDGLATRLTADIGQLGNDPLRALTSSELNGLVTRGGGLIAVLVGPIAVCTVALTRLWTLSLAP